MGFCLECCHHIEQLKLDRQEARDERRFQSGIKMAEKAEIRNEKKKTAVTEVEIAPKIPKII